MSIKQLATALIGIPVLLLASPPDLGLHIERCKKEGDSKKGYTPPKYRPQPFLPKPSTDLPNLIPFEIEVGETAPEVEETPLPPLVSEDLPPISEVKAVEVLQMLPKGEGPFPVVFLLHGDQEYPGKGAREFEENHLLEALSEAGIVAIAISEPGFGASLGERDICGLEPLKAVQSAIEAAQSNPQIDPTKMAILGVGRGATLAALVFAQTPTLSLQILVDGYYDLSALKNPLLLPFMKERELGDEERICRSPLSHVTQMRGKTVIIHSELDWTEALLAAKMIHQKLEESTFLLLPNTLRGRFNLKNAVLPSLRSHLVGLYGIGLYVDLQPPFIQVVDTLPGSPASRSEKIHSGDLLLSLSKEDDTIEVDLVGLSLSELESLVLGPNGASLRLKVMHLDRSIEELSITRGSYVD